MAKETTNTSDVIAKELRIAKIDGKMLRSMIICGANRLTANTARINALNVFPVPDGDTGTNMSLTAIAAAREVEKITENDILAVSKAAASGALRGGRGNSGVIFSQLFRGFSKSLENANAKTIGSAEFAAALANASKTAYKAVMYPQEGTMLTVARHVGEIAEKTNKGFKDIEAFANELHAAGQVILKKTPDMLPVLKQAGVVDSGGEGLVVFFAGAIEGMRVQNPKVVTDSEQGQTEGSYADFASHALGTINPEDITFGYCTEFLIVTSNFSEMASNRLKAYLETMGDSVALVSDDDFVKVHVHTENPGKVLEKAMAIGPLDGIKIDNMRVQYAEQTAAASVAPTAAPPAELKEIGVVAVVSGDGFKEIFQELGADFIIEGGQTMNPSAEDIAHGVAQVHAKNVIILPNNKNITLAAQQATYLCEGKNVSVIETKSLPQGISAMICYMPDSTLNENLDTMQESMANVRTGQITNAVRDTTYNGQDVREGDYIGILDGKIICSHEELDIAAKELINAMMQDSPPMFTIFTGADAQGDDTTSLSIQGYLQENYSDCELDVAHGGQAVYHYIFSAE